MKKIASICTVATVCLLTGCVHLETPTASNHFVVEKPAVRQAQLTGIQQWKIKGAFSVTQTGQQPDIANYVWTQKNPNQYRIQISSALNLYTITLVHESNIIALYKNGVLKWYAKTPEALMQKALGWSLPLQPLQSWIKGTPAAGQYHARYDEYGHIILLQQFGWTIKYDAYKTENNIDFPQLMTLQRPNWLVKIVIHPSHIDTNTVY